MYTHIYIYIYMLWHRRQSYIHFCIYIYIYIYMHLYILKETMYLSIRCSAQIFNNNNTYFSIRFSKIVRKERHIFIGKCRMLYGSFAKRAPCYRALLTDTHIHMNLGLQQRIRCATVRFYGRLTATPSPTIITQQRLARAKRRLQMSPP